jgi:hypothetical protein
MLSPAFHALGWDGPGLLFEVDFRLPGAERFTGAGRGQGRKLKRRRGDGSAFAKVGDEARARSRGQHFERNSGPVRATTWSGFFRFKPGHVMRSR